MSIGVTPLLKRRFSHIKKPYGNSRTLRLHEIILSFPYFMLCTLENWAAATLPAILKEEELSVFHF